MSERDRYSFSFMCPNIIQRSTDPLDLVERVGPNIPQSLHRSAGSSRAFRPEYSETEGHGHLPSRAT